MSRFIWVHRGDKKILINPERVDGIIDTSDNRLVYVGGGTLPFEADDSIEDLYRMICGDEPEEDEDGIRVGDEVTIKNWLGTFIVLEERVDYLYTIGEAGVLLMCGKESCTKTGRHFDKMKDVAGPLINAMKEWKGEN